VTHAEPKKNEYAWNTQRPSSYIFHADRSFGFRKSTWQTKRNLKPPHEGHRRHACELVDKSCTITVRIPKQCGSFYMAITKDVA
jgi:hypothetical protein